MANTLNENKVITINTNGTKILGMNIKDLTVKVLNTYLQQDNLIHTQLTVADDTLDNKEFKNVMLQHSLYSKPSELAKNVEAETNKLVSILKGDFTEENDSKVSYILDLKTSDALFKAAGVVAKVDDKGNILEPAPQKQPIIDEVIINLLSELVSKTEEVKTLKEEIVELNKPVEEV